MRGRADEEDDPSRVMVREHCARSDKHIEREAEDVVDGGLHRVGDVLGAMCGDAWLESADADFEAEAGDELD